MVTAIDTNVLVTLLEADSASDIVKAQNALENASLQGTLIISPVVYAELLAGPRGDEAFLEAFFRDTGIRVEWQMKREVWKWAGQAYGSYAQRRRQQRGDVGPRRILADFLIGAHAHAYEARLLTFDAKVYRQAFEGLTLVPLEI